MRTVCPDYQVDSAFAANADRGRQRGAALFSLLALRRSRPFAGASRWADATLVPPSPRSRHGRRVKMDAFLAEIKLGQHAAILDKLGYDDPNDFA